MNVLRKRPILRSISLLCLLFFMNSLFGPSIVMALTTGPHQPEYMGYEEPGASDMVNLLTGDFSFRVPAIDIPGPEGGFSLPLSYKAGIGLEQEASWVGLGWSLNAGAITRNIVEYPDDASGESFQIHRFDDDVERGWRGSIPGIGSIGWNTNDGHTGRISLLGLIGFNYKNGSVTAGNLVGFDYNKDGVTADPVAIASAAVTIATLGAASGPMEAAKQAAISVGVEAAVTAAVGVGSPQIGAQGYWHLSKRTDKRLFHTNYWIWLDQTRYEDMYGVLNLGDMERWYYDIPAPKVYTSGFDNTGLTPVYLNFGQDLNEQGAASDMYYYYDGSDYHLSSSPTSLAKDNYNVMGPGISGAIEPYRLDAGTLSMPRQMTPNHVRVAAFPWKSRAWPESYKVQFKYRGSNANAYYHHVGATASGFPYTVDLNDPKFGIEHEVNNVDPELNNKLAYTTSDPSLPTYYPFSFSNAKIEENRAGLTGLGLAQEKDINWFTNQDIIDGNATGLIDCFDPTQRSSELELDLDYEFPVLSGSGGSNVILGKNNVGYFDVGDDVEINGLRLLSTDPLSPPTIVSFTINTTVLAINQSSITINATLPTDMSTVVDIKAPSTHISSKTIGAYKIIREDGKAYHYTLPIYEWNSQTHIASRTDPDRLTTLRRIEPFPSTWLLTAITGSDFVDRNNNNQIDGGDWGHWVKLDYGKFSGDYNWRIPYEGYMNTSDGESKMYAEGKRQQYYLNSIQTRTHTALFIKDVRKDGYGVGNEPSSSLLLDEIILLKNDDLALLETSGLSTATNATHINILDGKDDLVNVYDIQDITSALRSTINQEAIRRVKFNYDYSLCTGALNSFDVVGSSPANISTVGKLTLTSVSYRGRNDTKVFPDFTFQYGFNPGYDKHKWDGWGYYNSSATSDESTHTASNSDNNGYAWSLSSIQTPLGHTIVPEYERDRYNSISGNATATKRGGDIRVKSLRVTDGTRNYKTRYEYSNGVVAQEPDYIKTIDYDFYNLFDFPLTPVMYGEVSVYTGANSNNSDYHTKQVYTFTTPNASMITKNEQTIFDGTVITRKVWNDEFTELVVDYNENLAKALHVIDVNTSSIGSLNSINIYDASNNLINSSVMSYSNDAENRSSYDHQGTYTEGSFLMERIIPFGQKDRYHRVHRTTKRYHPNFLTQVTTTNSEGHQVVKVNKTWDFLTGRVLETEDQSAMGITTLTEIVPGYEVYSEMGSRRINLNNKSMTGANVATYVYKTTGLGGSKIGLIGANVQTWNKDWGTYRALNGSGEYVDVDNGEPTWRRAESYVYQGDPADLKTDGTLTFIESTDKFDWTSGASNPNWQYSGELLRFDSYSMPLESKDLNDIRTVVKTDIQQQKKVLEAANAKYTEVAWSGAENGYISSSGNTYVDGEVRIVNSTKLSSNYAHTGRMSLQLSSMHEKGFYYVIKPGEYDPDRNYRLGVWVRNIPHHIQLYYKLGTTLTPLTASTLQSGDWHRVEAMIPASALNGTQNLEVGCRTVTGANVYVDDFRFQPIDAGLTAYVYNDRDELTYTLDNENFFTEYQYNDQGRLVRTYVETSAHGRVQLSETTQHFKRDGE